MYRPQRRLRFAPELVHNLEMEFGLAIETSGNFGGVALGSAGAVLSKRQFQVPKRHAAEFLPNVDAVTTEAGATPNAIRIVYVSIGPGSFTGLRIGLACARALAMANNARIVAVPTLQAIAQNALDADPQPQNVAVFLDAKRSHVYAAAFSLRDSLYEPTSQPVEVDPAAFLGAQPPGCAVLGDGLLLAQHRAAAESVGAIVLNETLYSARPEMVYRLGWMAEQRGEFREPRSLVPAYIRLPESEERWQQRQNAAPAKPQ